MLTAVAGCFLCRWEVLCVVQPPVFRAVSCGKPPLLVVVVVVVVAVVVVVVVDDAFNCARCRRYMRTSKCNSKARLGFFGQSTYVQAAPDCLLQLRCAI